MEKEQTTFTKMETTKSEKIFEVQTIESNIKAVRAFQPELRGGEIVLPMEFAKTDDASVLLGFALDKEILRELLDAADFPDTI